MSNRTHQLREQKQKELKARLSRHVEVFGWQEQRDLLAKQQEDWLRQQQTELRQQRGALFR